MKVPPLKVPCFLFLVLSSLEFSAPVQAATAVSFGGNYYQNFDTLAISGTADKSTLPTGWDISGSSYNTDNGSTGSNGVYSYGISGSSERALGMRGSTSQYMGIAFTNNTLSTITALNVNYRGEQWRRDTGSAGTIDSLEFTYSTNATALNAGNFTAVPMLNFVSPYSPAGPTALVGNAAGNYTDISGTITGLSIASGTTFWLRWESQDKTPSGGQDGLAIDSLSVALVPEPAAPTLLGLSASLLLLRRRRVACGK